MIEKLALTSHDFGDSKLRSSCLSTNYNEKRHKFDRYSDISLMIHTEQQKHLRQNENEATVDCLGLRKLPMETKTKHQRNVSVKIQAYHPGVGLVDCAFK